MNLFEGMSHQQIISALLMIGIFTVYAVLVAAACAAFYVIARPRGGRVRTAAVWQLVALVWFFWANVAMVWAAPAENTFVTPSGGYFDFGYLPSQRLFIGFIFAALGVVCMVVGWFAAAGQARRYQESALSV